MTQCEASNECRELIKCGCKNVVLKGVGARKLIYREESFASVEKDAFKLFTIVKYGFSTKPRLNFMNITTFKTKY